MHVVAARGSAVDDLLGLRGKFHEADGAVAFDGLAIVGFLFCLAGAGVCGGSFGEDLPEFLEKSVLVLSWRDAKRETY